MFDSIEAALQDLKAGKMVIVVDDEDRENEGDLIAVAEWMNDDTVNFMATHGRGLICTPVSKSIANSIGLKPMVQNNTDPYGTAFTISIDHKDTTTGISAYERTLTIRKLLEDDIKVDSFNQPGHVFPLIAKENGVLERVGHTEAAVDLAKLTDAKPIGVICEIMNDDGTMARVDDLIQYKEKHDLKLITIKDLVAYRQKTEMNVNRVASVNMPTQYGEFKLDAYIDINGAEHLMIYNKKENNMSVRIHSSCVTGDIFHSARCDCGEQLNNAMRYIENNGGAILYLFQEGRGIGLVNKLKAYELIKQGYDTVSANTALGFDADLRTYEVAAHILKYNNIDTIQLLTNNPDKINKIKDLGIEVSKRVPLIIESNPHNNHYLITKIKEMGHLL
ncbi:3,4-dihydroxy-2-butanone-4-phosphate synthase [Nosocomiicoccus ampullae]|uniref:Riboflavin biosynthesis protein RibBA n=2 Tax=Nosocomiicoccus ampullae TaxID=489910 RepID=A0A9Q2CZ65_9STAP|nr:3,4-dihydroxy 2-butanone 4-phosphate synthase/GTP cyclohydrolase II [Nosocomiicoccus ampullae]QYA46921.1 3,4-dihydroxy-2-butanone-4-phosphate synthase [Nosocomiicoccus ampullae]